MAHFEVKPVKVQVLVDGKSTPGAVVLEDITLEGLRGRWDRKLPDSGDFPLRLHLPDPVNLTARVTWQRLLPSGGALAGVTVTPCDSAAAATLGAYLQRLHAPSRRRAPRVADILPLDVVVPEDEEWYSAIATDLSEDGICVISDHPLPENKRLLVIMLLGWGPPVEVEAHLRWCHPSPWQGFAMGLEFLEPSPAARSEILEYLATDMEPETAHL